MRSPFQKANIRPDTLEIPIFLEPEGSLRNSQDIASWPDLDPNESRLQCHSSFFKMVLIQGIERNSWHSKFQMCCEFWDYRNDVAEDSFLLGRDAASVGSRISTFRDNVDRLYKLIIGHISSRRSGHYIALERRHLIIHWRSVMTQKNETLQIFYPFSITLVVPMHLPKSGALYDVS